ncbi:MAG: pilus assembly protein MshP [Gammaproteobacteria bacterium]|nr:pilus assembly protein MshP [Gammaproteobacteria bacterium]
MKQRCMQRGFTLIAAIFLLVVVAALVVYMTNIRVVQQTTLLYGVQGARASQAARSGIEWGIFQSIVNSSCVASSNFGNAAFSGFNIEVRCAQTTHTEGNTAIDVYQITAIASSGVFGSLDYVQRRIQATVSQDPP